MSYDAESLFTSIQVSETIDYIIKEIYKNKVIKVGLSLSKKKLIYFFQWKPVKNDAKCFLLHLKSSFRSQDVYIFVLIFWLCRKSQSYFQNLWRHNMANKQLQYTYCPISDEVKTTRKQNLVK